MSEFFVTSSFQPKILLPRTLLLNKQFIKEQIVHSFLSNQYKIRVLCHKYINVNG